MRVESLMGFKLRPFSVETGGLALSFLYPGGMGFESGCLHTKKLTVIRH